VRPTFSNAWDRLTYVVAEAQLLVAGVLVATGALLAWFQPTIPSAPPWAVDLASATLLFGPPLFLAGTKFARWLRTRRWVEVYHVKAPETVAHYYVPPETWASKTVEGPGPWPVNDGEAWAVREWEYHEDTEDLYVRGTWYSALSDDKLMTARRHTSQIHESLIDAKLELGALVDRIDEMGAEIQKRVLTAASEARQRGRMLDKTAVKDAVEEAKESVETEEELPTIEEVDLPDGELGDQSPVSIDDPAGGSLDSQQEAATDGGSDDL
jgi:hypothetical protein